MTGTEFFETVVVGVGGSRAADEALRWAAERVPAAGLHVVRSGTPAPIIADGIATASIRTLDRPAADALLEVAAEVDADAIVIGPHGTGIGRGLGSVARKLLSSAPLPLLVIDGADEPRPAGGPVVACVGYGEPALAAATWAAGYAEQRRLPLVLLHSVAYRPLPGRDSMSEVLASYLGAGVSKEWAKDELDDLAAELRSAHPSLSIDTHVEGTSVLAAVTKAGAEAELVVLGKRSDDEFLHELGTPRLRKLVARTRFPTAVVPVRSSG